MISRSFCLTALFLLTLQVVSVQPQTTNVGGISLNVGSVLSSCSSEVTVWSLCAPLDITSCPTCYEGQLNQTQLPKSCSDAQSTLCSTVAHCSSACGGSKCQPKLENLIICALSTVSNGTIAQLGCQLGNCTINSNMTSAGTATAVSSTSHGVGTFLASALFAGAVGLL